MSKRKRRPPRKITRPKAAPDKYRTDKYIPHIFSIELSILNADVVMKSRLTDGEVIAAVHRLIGYVRKTKKLPHHQEEPSDEDTKSLIIWLISENWQGSWKEIGKISSTDMIGCLEVVAESVESRMRKPHQRHYLEYLRKFIKRAGVDVDELEQLAAEVAEDELDELDEFDELDEDLWAELFDKLDNMSLAEIGELWLEFPDMMDLADAFENKAHDQIAHQDEAQLVIKVCNRLLNRADELDYTYLITVFYTVQGQAYRHMGQIDRAINRLQTARQLDEGYFGARSELGEIYYEQEKYEQAIEVWQECLLGASSDAYIYRRIAAAYRQMGRLADEEQTWRELLPLQRRRGCCLLFWVKYDNIATLAYLADCLERQHKTEEFNKVVAHINSNMPLLSASLSEWSYWVYYRLQRKKDVEFVLKALTKQEPLMKNPNLAVLLRACVYDWLEQPEQAAPLWEAFEQSQTADVRASITEDVQEILGPVLPPSSRLFELTEPAQESDQLNKT